MMTSVNVTYDFISGMYINSLELRKFKLNIHLQVSIVDPVEQLLAFDRLDLIMYEMISNGVFVNVENKEAITQLLDSGINVITLPSDEMTTQTILLTLVSKLNTISGNILVIMDASLEDDKFSDIKYKYFFDSENEIVNEFGSDPDSWWLNDSPLCIEKEHLMSNVFDSAPTWADLGLEWGDELNKETKPKKFNVVQMKPNKPQ